MISCSQDAIVPLTEVVFLMVEEVKFGNEEMIEVSVHESWRRLLERGEPSPVKVGSEGAVAVGIAEVRGEGVGIGARRYQACWDSTEVNGAWPFPVFCDRTNW